MINTKRLVETFKHLLLINSPSGQEDAISEWLVRELSAQGFEPKRDAAGNVIVRTEGSGRPLLLCAHMDTVEPTEGIQLIEKDGLIRTDGTTILGADDKSGIAVILEAVRSAERHPPLDIVFTVHEEGGLLGAKALDVEALRARQGIVLDSGGPIGTVVTAAPSQYKLTATILGIAAHAGVEPEKGVNAIVAAARAICAMNLGRVDSETTANIGVIRGGQATNIVPEYVELSGEARSHSEESLDDQVQSMRSALERAANDVGARVEIDIERSYTRFSIPDEHPLVQAVFQIAAEMGLEGKTLKGGGGSDANVFNAAGLECINMSTGMAGAHSKEEYIEVNDLVQSARLLTGVLEHLAE